MIVIAALVLNFITQSWANREVMNEFSYRFAMKMVKCGEQANYTQEMADDILKYWDQQHPLEHEQTGCLLVCAMQRLELTAPGGALIPTNAEAFARSTGADDDKVSYLLELYTRCHRDTSAIPSRCLAALEMSKCFRQDVFRRGWTPDMITLLQRYEADRV